MRFLDKNKELMEVGDIIIRGDLFAIVDLPSEGEDMVGLFLEDDTNYFLETSFHYIWLADLARVVDDAISIYRKKKKKNVPKKKLPKKRSRLR